MKRHLLAAILALTFTIQAAELQLELGTMPVGELPKGFSPLLYGSGQPGDWKVILDDVAPALAPLTARARPVKQPVIAQTSTDATDERYPMLVYDTETFEDFDASFRFKMVSGKAEQMAGFVFRLQDENNFYIIRASSLGGTFRFYKVVKGKRSQPIPAEIKIPSGEWHEMQVSSTANKIVARLDGKQMFALSDDTEILPPGKVGFWTKSDSVTYFTDFQMVYKPRIPLAQALVNDTMKRLGRIVGLRVYATDSEAPGLKVIASDKKDELGMKAMDEYKQILAGAAYAYGHTKKTVTVSLPLRDRNGDIAAVVRVEMERFPGQTENNALARSLPVIKLMEQRIKSKRDLSE